MKGNPLTLRALEARAALHAMEAAAKQASTIACIATHLTAAYIRAGTAYSPEMTVQVAREVFAACEGQDGLIDVVVSLLVAKIRVHIDYDLESTLWNARCLIDLSAAAVAAPSD